MENGYVSPGMGSTSHSHEIVGVQAECVLRVTSRIVGDGDILCKRACAQLCHDDGPSCAKGLSDGQSISTREKCKICKDRYGYKRSTAITPQHWSPSQSCAHHDIAANCDEAFKFA